MSKFFEFFRASYEEPGWGDVGKVLLLACLAVALWALFLAGVYRAWTWI